MADDGDRASRSRPSLEEELARVTAELAWAEEAIADLFEQLDGVGRLEEARQAEIGQLTMDHRAALAELRVANVVALGAIEEARQADLGQLQIDHREALAAVDARHRAALDEVAAAHAMQVVELEAAHAEALGDLKRSVEARIATLEREREEALGRLPDASRRVTEVEKEWAARERAIVEAHAEEMATVRAARTEHDAWWREMLAAAEEARVRAEQERIDAVRAAEEARVRAEHERIDVLRAAEAARAAEIEALAEDHRKNLTLLAAEHTAAVAQERLAFEQLLAALQDDIAAGERRLGEARAAHEQDRAELLARHAEELARVEERVAELDTELGRERAERRRLEAEPQPRPELAPRRWSRPPAARPSRVHASLGDALLAAAAERDEKG